jgi:hypothetical protein
MHRWWRGAQCSSRILHQSRVGKSRTQRCRKRRQDKSHQAYTLYQTEGLGWGKDSLRRCARLALLRQARTARRWGVSPGRGPQGPGEGLR